MLEYHMCHLHLYFSILNLIEVNSCYSCTVMFDILCVYAS